MKKRMLFVALALAVASVACNFPTQRGIEYCNDHRANVPFERHDTLEITKLSVVAIRQGGVVLQPPPGKYIALDEGELIAWPRQCEQIFREHIAPALFPKWSPHWEEFMFPSSWLEDLELGSLP